MKPNQEQLKEIYHMAIEQSSDGVLLIHSSGSIHHVNDKVSQITGFDKEELLTMNISDLDPLYPPERVRQLFQETYKQQKISFESFFRSKDGTDQPIEATNNYLDFEGEKYTCTFIRDIKRRKDAEAALKDSEQRFGAILNHHFQMTGLIDTDGVLLMANETALRMVGVKTEDVVGRYMWETPWWDHSETLQNRLKAEIRKAATGEFARFEIDYIDLEGETHTLDFSLTPLSLRDTGEIDFIIPEGRDITELKSAEVQLQSALAELQELKQKLQEENIYLQEEIRIDRDFNDIIGQGDAYREMIDKVRQVAITDTSVLISGESGTGKELVARAIHDLSRRSDRPIVKVNCAALPANLIESQLFGHEKGAFTGALMRNVGRFELADKGTIFLDEIGEIPLDLQAKLLRVLQEGEFERLGSPRTYKADVRVIAASNRDLKEMTQKGLFREDLYYRLNVFPVECPSLRERQEDIPILVRHFIEKYRARTDSRVENISKTVMDVLVSYSWPGNVRELENIIERALITSRGRKLEVGSWLNQENNAEVSGTLVSLEENERRHILKALQKTTWRVSGEQGAAKALKINPQTLVSRMKKLGIKRPS